ncbi:MAG: efflux RND transporter periplasmic adaptor subunit [Cytophagales bacterium]|nr:efflux RND transporter periplasmic adaptor subunit [Armatimonadota bacterium]
MNTEQDPGDRPHKTIAMMTVLGLAALLTFGSVACGKSGDAADADKSGKGGTAAKGQPAAQQSTPVTVTPAAEQTVTRSVPVTGSITALQSVSLTPKISARVVRVSGREGASVSAGEIVVQQDTSDLRQQLEQAQANLQSAQARLNQAQTNYRIQQSTSSTGVQNAQAGLASARSNLTLARNPQRSEQVTQAEIAVRQAKANYERAVADRKRYDYLVKEGAAAQATLDQYATTEAVQKANLENAQQSLKIALTGGRTEQVAQAQEQFRQAEIALQQARSNVQQNQVSQGEIRAAQAAVAQNRAAVDLARQQVADAAIRSPISGVISVRSTEPGQQAAPGAAVATLVSLGTVYFQAQVPETTLRDIQQNQSVEAKIDAYPNKSFRGRVARIYPTGSTSSRTFSVRVDIPNEAGLLKPGMFARGQVILERRRGIVIPKDALVAKGGDTSKYQVFLATGGGKTAKAQDVKIGITTDLTAEIVTGVQSGDQVITAGQDGLKDGAPIQVEGGGSGTSAPQQAAAL